MKRVHLVLLAFLSLVITLLPVTSARAATTKGSTDSFVLVTVSGSATFTSIPNGTYTDAVTGDVKTVTTGSLTIPLVRAYVVSFSALKDRACSSSPYMACTGQAASSAA